MTPAQKTTKLIEIIINFRAPMTALLMVLGLMAMTPSVQAQSASPSPSQPTTTIDTATPVNTSTLEQLEQRLRALQAELARLTRKRAAAHPPPNAPGAPSVIADLEHLALELQALDQRVRIFQRNLELEREQADARAAAQPRVTAGREGFALQSSDSNFRLRLRGYVQSDGRFYLADSGLSTPGTFVLRRVRPVLDATMFKLFDIRIMPDFGGGTTALQDAYFDARLRPYFKVRAGKFKSPFGLERLVSALDLTFVERGAPTLLAPNRDLGAMVYGDTFTTRLTYQAAVMNGVVDGGSADIDDRKGKDVIARVFAEPFKPNAKSPLKGLGLGFAASFGEDLGSGTVTGLPTFRTSGNQTFFRYRADNTVGGTAFSDGNRTRTSGQGHWYHRAFGVLAELTASRQDVRIGTTLQAITNTASVVSASYFLTGESASSTTVQPRRDFDAGGGAWGAIEVTGRFTRLDVDDDAFPLFANPAVSASSANEWATGINWYLNRSVKYSLSVHETHFTGGAPNGGDRRTERDLLTRVQFAF
jgi:phosphate-selective porin OprO/OprP